MPFHKELQNNKLDFVDRDIFMNYYLRLMYDRYFLSSDIHILNIEVHIVKLTE